MPKRARSLAKRMSAIEAMSIPAPTAAPLTAAMYGFSSWMSARGMGWTRSRRLCRRSATVSCVCSTPSPPASWATSMPLQNPRPAPVRMMARTPRSASDRSIASRHSDSIRSSKALSRSGRLSVIVATPPATSYTMCSYSIAAIVRGAALPRPPRRAHAGPDARGTGVHWPVCG